MDEVQIEQVIDELGESDGSGSDVDNVEKSDNK